MEKLAPFSPSTRASLKQHTFVSRPMAARASTPSTYGRASQPLGLLPASRRLALPPPPRAAAGTAATTTSDAADQKAQPSSAWPSAAARAAAFTATPVPELFTPTLAPLLSGALPVWLNGAFIRNGPGGFPAPYAHLFDGPAMLTRVALDGRDPDARPPTQTQRFIETAAWAGFKAMGKPVAPEFGTPLPFWAGLFTTVKGLMGFGSGFDNASVTVRPRGRVGVSSTRQLIAMTEAVAGTYAVDALTLETAPGRVVHPPSDGVRGALTTAHAHTRTDGSLVAFTSDVGRGFTVYTQDPHTLARTPVASFRDRPGSKGGGPAWVHDFPCTDAHACLPEAGATLDLRAALVGGGDHFMFAWDGRAGTRFTLVPLPPPVGVQARAAAAAAAAPPPPAAVRVIDSPEPLFYFHILNAFEDGKGAFVFDVPRFPDPTMVNRLGLAPLRAGPGDAAVPGAGPVPPCEVVRVSLPLAGPRVASITTLIPAAAVRFFEFPQINPAWKGRADYRFAYGVGAPLGPGPPASLGTAISKLDVRGGTVCAQWRGEDGGIPGEPLFVGRPGGVGEDDGVLLFHWTNPGGGSEVVVLEAAGLGEVARVGLPAAVAYGFHGCWLPGAE